MSLSAALPLAAACYALLTFFLLPSLRVAWKSERRPQKILRAGVLAGVEVLARFSLISTLTILAVILVVYGFGLLSPPSVSSTQSFLGIADGLLNALSALKSTWTQILFVLGFAVSGFAFYRMSRNRLDGAFRTALEKEVDRLRKAKSLGAGAWPFLPPTAEMQQLDRMSNELHQEITRQPPGSKERRLFEEAVEKISAKREGLDFERRINVEVELGETPHEGNNRITRFWTVLCSAGFASDLKGVGVFIRTAASVLLVLCLTSVYAGPASKVITDRKIELRDLRITRLLEETQKTRSALPTDPTVSPSPSPEETAGLEALSNEFELAIKNDPAWSHVAIQPRNTDNATQMRADWVRVHVRAKDLPHQVAKNRQPELFPTDQWRQNRASAFEYATTQKVTSPSSIQQSFVTDWKKENLQQIKDMSKKLRDLGTLQKKDYRKPRSWSDLHDWALGEVIGAVLDGVPPEAKNSVTSQLEKASSKTLEEAINTYYKIRFNQFVVAFARGGIDEARKSFSSGTSYDDVFPDALLPMLGDAARPESYSELSAKLRQVLERINITASETDRWSRSMAAAKAIADTSPIILKDLGFSNLDVLAESFVQYASDFPASKSEPRLSEVLKKSWGLQEDDTKLSSLIASSRDFHKQENNPDTGGMIIGRNVYGTPDLVGIDWNLRGDSISFEITASSGNRIKLGPYPASLAYQALLFASDERPVAVTEIYDSVAGRRKLTLHPVFSDSSFGNHLIRMDQWIFDSLVGPDRDRNTAIEEAALYQINLYNDLARHLADARLGRLQFKIRERKYFDVLPESSSPLTTTTGFFNEYLVKDVFKCAHKNDSGWCLTSGLGDSRTVDGSAVVSQIRESEYSIEPNLSFLSDTRNGSLFTFEILIPLDQSAAWYVADREKLRAKVLAHIANRGEGSYLTELSQLTVMQRLFRAALHGTLGQHFPVEKIGELADTLAPSKPKVCKTARWEAEVPKHAAPFELRFASLLAASAKSAQQSAQRNTFPPDPSIPGNALLARMKKCQFTIENSKGPISDSDWKTSCSFDEMPSFVMYPDQNSKDYAAHKKDSYQLSDLVATANRLRNLQSLVLQEGGTSGDCEVRTVPGSVH
jgi:hypothetical protein